MAQPKTATPEKAEKSEDGKTYADYSGVRHYDDAYRLTNLGIASPEQIRKWRTPREEGGMGILPPEPTNG